MVEMTLFLERGICCSGWMSFPKTRSLVLELYFSAGLWRRKREGVRGEGRVTLGSSTGQPPARPEAPPARSSTGQPPLDIRFR